MFRNFDFKSRFANTQQMGEAPLNPWTLRFRDRDLENKFNEEHVERDLPTSVIYMVIGVFAYLTYGLLDLLVLEGEELAAVLNIRMWVTPFSAFLCILCFVKGSDKYIQFILSTCMLVSGLGIISMTCILSEPFNHIYYAGLILVVSFYTNLVIARFTHTVFVSAVLFAVYVYAAAILRPIPEWALISNLFFMTMAIVWNGWISYWSDYYIRSDFANRSLLMNEKKKSEVLLVKAEAGNKAKSEFLAIMSHELRTPLNAIIGFSEVIQNKLFGPIGNDKYDSYVEDISSSGHHLLSIINDILDLSKAESGQLELNEDLVEAKELVDQAMRMFLEKAASERIHLTVHVPDDMPSLCVDPRQYRQMIMNLVSNAIKFTKTDGSVHVSLKMNDEGGCDLVVADTGMGISEEDLPKVVEPFIQVESSLSRENGGTGLGLPLVKKMIELHGGQLDLTSELGLGTRATLTLPAERVGALSSNPGLEQAV